MSDVHNTSAEPETTILGSTMATPTPMEAEFQALTGTSVAETEGRQLPLVAPDQQAHGGEAQEAQSFNTETFHPFPKLPAEIRMRIFKYMIPGPRVIEFNIHDSHCSGEAFFTHEPVPVAMHVCFDSRNEALKHYKPHFPRYDSEDGSLLSEAQITMDLNKDILYVRSIFEMANLEMSTEDLDSIQFIALDATMCDSLSLFVTLRNLKEFIVVVDMNGIFRQKDDRTTQINIVFEDVRPLVEGNWVSLREYMQIDEEPLVDVNHLNDCLEFDVEHNINIFAAKAAELHEQHPEWNMPLLKIALRKLTAASKEELAELHKDSLDGGDLGDSSSEEASAEEVSAEQVSVEEASAEEASEEASEEEASSEESSQEEASSEESSSNEN